MKDKIIKKATEMFLKLGFKSVTMDDIACEMCISKKTIYKFFGNKEVLIEEGTNAIQIEIKTTIDTIISQNHNAIEESFEIRKMFKEMFKGTDSSPIYQLKKHYPEIHEKVRVHQIEECKQCFTENIKKGILENLYRNSINIESFVKFYYEILLSINENNSSESEIQKLEQEAMEYHIRAMATKEGIVELEKHLSKTTI